LAGVRFLFQLSKHRAPAAFLDALRESSRGRPAGASINTFKCALLPFFSPCLPSVKEAINRTVTLLTLRL
jgi:hypothetical protein